MRRNLVEAEGLSGKDRENTRSADLVAELRKIGLATARFEPHHRVRKTDGRTTPSKPDITIQNGGVHIISAKWGAKKEFEAATTADEYRADLEPEFAREGKRIGEVMAVTYPATDDEWFILHARPRAGRHDLCFRTKTLEKLARQIKLLIDGRISEIEREQDPPFEEARRFLHLGTQTISNAIEGVPDELLEEVWGGHEFFHSLLLPKLKGDKRREALRAGAGYLFVNQVLFYCLLSGAAQVAGGEVARAYPPIDSSAYSSPKRLREEYFERVHSKDYEPVYALNIAKFLTTPSAESACKDLARSISSLAPKLTVPDLIGQVFQEFIDPGVRKKLGACYTNKNAARLLAELAVPTWDCTVLDPACGSGTLLVAAYRQKLALAGDRNPSVLHHRFVEKEITGIEAMGFAGHLAAVNLALQRPLVDTDYVRIAVADSTSHRPSGRRSVILPWDESAPRELRQARLDMDLSSRAPKGRRRIVEVSSRKARPIHLGHPDLVIMNPPFTSWIQMGSEYRESLKKSFSQERGYYRDAIQGKFSQQGFFLMLADLFLKDEGTLAAVLPVSTFTTVSFKRLISRITSNYSLKTIVVDFERAAFSEGSNFTECLLVAEKRPPEAGHRFSFVGVRTHPDKWTEGDIQSIVKEAQSPGSRTDLVTSLSVLQEDISAGNETIIGLLHRLQPEFGEAQLRLTEVLETMPLAKATWGEMIARKKLDVHRWVLGSELLDFYGPRALFIGRPGRSGRSENDRLVLDSADSLVVRARDRKTGTVYSFPSKNVVPALRRFGYITSLDSGPESDFAVASVDAELERAMADLYNPPEARVHLQRIRQTGVEYKGGRWAQRIVDGSSRLNVGIRFDPAVSGTTVLACRSDRPTFLAGYGFMVRGLTVREEKLFCLWANSTLYLIQALNRMTPTRGSYLKFEMSAIEQVVFPDFDKLSEDDWRFVEGLYDRATSLKWPSITLQLRGDPIKILVDEGMLELLGVGKEQRAETASALRSGALATIEALAATMGKPRRREEESDDAERTAGARGPAPPETLIVPFDRSTDQ